MYTPRDNDPKLRNFARFLRTNQTDAEKLIWSGLRDRRFSEWRFRRQRPVAGYIVDFFCPRANLAIELDGGQHGEPDAEAADAERTATLEKLGLRVLRFWNNDVLAQTDAVMQEIFDALELSRATPFPSPGTALPSPSTLGGGQGEDLRKATAAQGPPPGPLPEYREREVDIWNAIAAYWDEQVGEGNDFQKQLVMPATDRLLGEVAGQRVLDACCGNGNYSRRLGRRGAKVIAFDGAAAFIEIARSKTKPSDGEIVYHVADATDRNAVEALTSPASLDAAVCSFALMDLPTISPLLGAVATMLKPGGRFVWSVGHPSFHTNEAEMTARQQHGEGEPTQSFGVNVTRYAREWPHLSRGILGQPRPHWICHRSLSTLLGECFAAGFVVDGMEEPTFEPDTRARSPFSWARRPDLPPAIVVRLRKSR